MTAVLFALFSPQASAEPVDDGIQAQIHPPGFRFLSRELSGSTWVIEPTDLPLTWSCYDILIRDANLDLVFGPLSLSSALNRLDFEADIVSAVGRDMVVMFESTGGLCISFQTTLTELALREAQVSGSLFTQVYGPNLDVTFLEPLEIDAETTIDIKAIPDFVEDGLLLFLEDALLNFAETELQAQLPDLLASLTVDGFLYQTEFMGFEFGVTPSLVSNSDEGLYASAHIDLGGDGGPGRILDLAPRGQSHLAVGITEAMIEEVAVEAWKQGLITPDSETLATLFDDLLEGLGLGDGLDVQLGINAEPRVDVSPAGMSIQLPETVLTVTNDDGETLLGLEADLDGLLELKVEAGSLLLTAHELTADVTELDASRLLEGGPDNLQSFLESWVVRAGAAAIDDLEIYGSHFEALGYVLRIDDSVFEDDAVIAWATLFASDDPAVDRVPPSTMGELSRKGDVITATFSGRDDRPGPLVYSYRLNEGSWSTWSSETTVDFTARTGDNTFEVKARDVWHNEDPTPQRATITVVEEDGGCGCGTGPAPLGVAWLAGLGLLAAVRRQR